MIWDQEAERQVLGGMLSSEDVVGDVGEMLTAEDFAEPRHRRVFDAIERLFTSGQTVNAITVAEQMGGASKAFIADLLAEFSTESAARSAAAVVRRKAVGRELIRVGEQVKELGLHADPQAQDKAEQAIFDIADKRVRGDMRHLAASMRDAVVEMEEGEKRGLDTGFMEVDETLRGLKPGHLILVAARPGVGKSCFLTDIMRNVALSGKPAAMFSLEMSGSEISGRILRSTSRVSRPSTTDEWTKVTKAQHRLQDLPLWIHDTAPLTLMDLRAKCRRLKARKGLSLVAVDYLQLMEPPSGDNREQQIAALSRGLKLLAKDMNLPVVCATQLNRASENRNDKRPRLGDLRESGAQEQDADVVLMLHRQGMYDSTVDPSITQVIVSKNRNGPTGLKTLRFNAPLTHFSNNLESA